MPCCSSQVVLKRSSLRTQFFAHKARGNCTTANETEAHRQLKRMAAEAARANDWGAETEAPGESEAGDKWIADVLARKGKTKVAVEIQWSRQTDEEIWRRQRRYRESGVRCLWLFRQSRFPIDRRLPAARIGGGPEDGFVALIPTGSGWQSMPMDEFLRAFFVKRLCFGLPRDVAATVAVQAQRWVGNSCQREVQFVTGIEVVIGTNKLRILIATVRHDHPDLFQIVRSNFPKQLRFEVIEPQYHGSQKHPLSNRCPHCNALVGGYYEFDTTHDEETVCTFQSSTSEGWHESILREGQSQKGRYRIGWGVY